MSDIAKRVEQGKDDLIRQLMRAKLDRAKAAKVPAPAEDAPAEATKDGLTEEDADALAEMYAGLT